MPNHDLHKALKLGERITIPYATVLSVTTYEGRDYITSERKTFYRTRVKDIDDNEFVFSGNRSFEKSGDIITIRGSVKKFDNKFGYIRLNRVRVMTKHSSLYRGLTYE